MTEVIWAPQAIQDVEAIRAHVARDSPHYADLLVERLILAVERLTDNPRSGRVVPELGDESIREVIHGNYRIVYRLRHDLVEIRPCFMALACFDSTDNDDIRASNFPMNPPEASRCSATAGYRERYAHRERSRGEEATTLGVANGFGLTRLKQGRPEVHTRRDRPPCDRGDRHE